MQLSTFLFYCRDEQIIEVRRRTHYITANSAFVLYAEICDGVRGNPDIEHFFVESDKLVVYLR